MFSLGMDVLSSPTRGLTDSTAIHSHTALIAAVYSAAVMRSGLPTNDESISVTVVNFKCSLQGCSWSSS